MFVCRIFRPTLKKKVSKNLLLNFVTITLTVVNLNNCDQPLDVNEVFFFQISIEKTLINFKTKIDQSRTTRKLLILIFI